MLNSATIYLGDNGRAFCGSLHCAGMTAYYSGRDLSGQAVEPIAHPDDVRAALAAHIKCEQCGKSPSLVVVERVVV
jgi:hypothetical protein